MDEGTYRYTSEDITGLRTRIEILSALHSALERWPEVAELAHSSESAESFLSDVGALLGIGEVAALAVADMQVRRVSRAERERLREQLESYEAELKIALEQDAS